ncbi:MAG: response regulator, partial [Gemmatimonadota bacterium]|nr:response regulator [Gemmatimonadota bacterium]
GESTIDELLRVVDVPQEDESTASKEPERRRSSGSHRRISGDGSALAPDSTRRREDIKEAVQELAGRGFDGEFELLEPLGPPEPQRHAVGTKVLLVDDEDQLRKVMKDLLERDGYEVTEAADGVEALDQVDRHAPDIIVLDLNLPGLDGYGVLTHLRSRPATQDMPVVVLTARGDEESEVRVFEMGADDFLSKPFRARALSVRLQAVLGRRRGEHRH